MTNNSTHFVSVSVRCLLAVLVVALFSLLAVVAGVMVSSGNVTPQNVDLRSIGATINGFVVPFWAIAGIVNGFLLSWRANRFVQRVGASVFTVLIVLMVAWQVVVQFNGFVVAGGLAMAGMELLVVHFLGEKIGTRTQPV